MALKQEAKWPIREIKGHIEKQVYFNPLGICQMWYSKSIMLALMMGDALWYMLEMFGTNYCFKLGWGFMVEWVKVCEPSTKEGIETLVAKAMFFRPNICPCIGKWPNIIVMWIVNPCTTYRTLTQDGTKIVIACARNWLLNKWSHINDGPKIIDVWSMDNFTNCQLEANDGLWIMIGSTMRWLMHGQADTNSSSHWVILH